MQGSEVPTHTPQVGGADITGENINQKIHH